MSLISRASIEERLPLAVALDDVEGLHEVDERLLLRPEIRGRHEVRTDAVAQSRRLAHVKDMTAGVLHEVDARRARQLPRGRGQTFQP